MVEVLMSAVTDVSYWRNGQSERQMGKLSFINIKILWYITEYPSKSGNQMLLSYAQIKVDSIMGSHLYANKH